MIYWLPKLKENNDGPNIHDSETENVPINESDSINDKSTENAIAVYRKLREDASVDPKELTENEIAQIEKECKIIENRETITQDTPHEPVEIVSDKGLVITGPPTLTRFEKARIMGARALQLSLGAPVFIEIPKNATSSLEIAMEELEQRVIPISIRRVQPNGDFQNIPLFNFN